MPLPDGAHHHPAYVVFMTGLKSGKYQPDDIHDHIDYYYRTLTHREIWDFLGMTYEQYQAWQLDNSVLRVFARS